MSTDTIYKEFVLESIIKQILDNGQSPTTELIDSMYNTYILGKDFTLPLFDNTVADVVIKENASANKTNNTNYEIWRDLQISYTTILKSTNNAIQSFDRWRTESINFESKLNSLNMRIQNLIRTQTNLNSHYISEAFADSTDIDLANSNTYLNLKDNNVSLNVSDAGSNRINLNYINPNDITFTVLSRTFLQSVITAPGADLINAVNDLNNFWQSRVYLSNAQPATCELKFKISDTPISISKISCMLHCANTNSSMQITPLISTDGINFNQLNTSNITVSTINNASWNFASVPVSYIKLILTKNGFDFNQDNAYIYEFGMQDLAVYNQGFSAVSQTMTTNALFAPDLNNLPYPFFSAMLETCDDIPTNTDIEYAIAALVNPMDTPTWVSIDPTNAINPIYPNIINFGDKNNAEFNNVEISFNSTGAAGYINPAANYNLISVSSGNIISTPVTATVNRYILVNSNDRLLNYEIDGSINVVDNSIKIFRNVGARGSQIMVRGIQQGWTFADPYYSTAIEVKNPNGVNINFGDQEIILDNDKVKGTIRIPQGIHSVMIKKNNWFNIQNGAPTLDILKARDTLFPFNQKLLIEGYTLNDPQNPYQGVDIFAGYFMTQTSTSDFITNVEVDDYSTFATDTDTIDAGIEKTMPSKVFMVKSNENLTDFLDELFTIRFDIQNQFFKYIKLKATLSTLDPTISPYLQSFQIKLSN